MSLAESIERRIAEYPEAAPDATWDRGTLRQFLRLHPEHARTCTTCVDRNGAEPRQAPYPCPTVQAVMDAVDFEAWQAARTAVAWLLDDLDVEFDVKPVATMRRPALDIQGRFAFGLVFGDDNERTVLMPGLPLRELRPQPGGPSTADLERLFLDGGSWWWPFALKLLARAP